MIYSKGISWFDDCRIPFVDDVNVNAIQNQNEKGDIYGGGKGYHKKGYQNKVYKPEGRFPPNLLVSDDMLNDGIITGGKDFKIQNKKEQTIYGGGKGFISKEKRVIKQDKGTNSRYYDIDLWFNNLLNNYIY